MSRARARLFGAIILVLVATPAYPQQAPGLSSRDLVETVKALGTEEKRFLEHARDFRDYGTSYPVEIDRATALLHEAGHAADHMGAAHLALLLYLFVPQSDREHVRPILQAHLDLYTRSLDRSVSVVNVYVSNAQSASIAASAARLKEDLRESKALLESIKLP